MKEKLKILLCLIVTVLLIGLIGYIVRNDVKAATEEVQNPVATFEVKDYGTVKMELYPEYAPNTVSNIIALIESGYYNDKIIYGKDDVCLYMARSAEDDGKGPTMSLIDSSIEADSEDDYEYEINGEFVVNKFEQNTLRHEKGIVSLNRSDYSSYGLTEEGYNSGSSQFSVMMGESSALNGMYCAFGRVTEGLDILEKIYNEAQVVATEGNESESNSTIKEFETKPVITSATVEKYGVDYGKPEVHEKFDVQSYLNNLYSQYYSN